MRTVFCISLDTGMRLLCRFTLWFEWKKRKKSVRVLRPWHITSKMALRWHKGDVTVTNCWIKSLFFVQNVFSSLYKRQIEPLMADGVFWRCFSYFSGSLTVQFLADATSIPVFIQDILNCVSKMNEAFMGSERHGGKWKMTTFSFWSGVSL